MDAKQLLNQIGRVNLLCISGGRSRFTGDTLILPVGSGYTVEITLDPSDTYTVRRVFTRGIKRWIKGEVKDVYADEVGEIAYEAHAFRSYEFGEAVTA
jgi:hypothetical protein